MLYFNKYLKLNFQTHSKLDVLFGTPLECALPFVLSYCPVGSYLQTFFINLKQTFNC